MFLSVIKLLSFLDFGSSIKFLILEGSIFCTKAKILSLSTPELNKYNFTYIKDKLTLKKQNKIIISINPLFENEKKKLCEKISQIIIKDKTINFLMDEKNPFFDTMPDNSISLINKKSINDFSKKISTDIEFERFRANIYIDGLAAWEERNWIGKTIKINNVDFVVSDEISRCSATNLKPSTDIVTINLPNKPIIKKAGSTNK